MHRCRCKTDQVQLQVRSRAVTLDALILNYIRPGSHIISDMWAAYANIDTIVNGAYLHSSINHSLHFVDPCDR